MQGLEDKTRKASEAVIASVVLGEDKMLAQDLMMWSGVIIGIGGALGVLWKLLSPIIKKTRDLLESLSRFTVDWFGEEAAPGRDKVPGVMERLNNIDGELKHNGGSTMKDAIKRIETKLKKIDERLEEGNKRFDSIEKRLNDEQ